MTKQGFIDSIQGFSDLFDFCYRNDLEGWVENIKTGGEVNDEIEDLLQDWINHESWDEIRDRLNEFEDEYYSDEYYRCSDWDYEYQYLNDDDLDALVYDMADSLEEQGFFDEEDEEENTAQYIEEPVDEPLFEEFTDEEFSEAISNNVLFQAIVKEKDEPKTVFVNEDEVMLREFLEEFKKEDIEKIELKDDDLLFTF